MTTIPDEPTDADPTQLENAVAAIDDAKAAAGRVAKDEGIDAGGDLPTEDENVPAAPSPPSEDREPTGADDDPPRPEHAT